MIWVSRYCQVRDTRKLDFAFNSSFTAVNVAKIMCSEYNLSIGRIKALMITHTTPKELLTCSRITRTRN